MPRPYACGRQGGKPSEDVLIAERLSRSGEPSSKSYVGTGVPLPPLVVEIGA
jgi:hypothetical protein